MKIEWDLLPKQTSEPEPYRMSGEKRNIISSEIQNLLAKGVLERCQETEGQFISNVFLKPKPNGKYRMILDLSILKGDLSYQHFKMTNLQTALDLMTPGCYMASLDLADAYYSIPIAEGDRKYLRLRWEGQLLQYTCLPNGLAQAPRNFTKILKPIHLDPLLYGDTLVLAISMTPSSLGKIGKSVRLQWKHSELYLLNLDSKIKGKKCVCPHQRNHLSGV